MKIVFLRGYFFLIAFLVMGSLFSQDIQTTNKAKQYIIGKSASWGLTKEDVSDLRVSDQYVSSTSKATFVYFNQRYSGIDIRNAISGVTITASGKVVYATNRFYSDIVSKVNATQPVLTAKEALAAAIRYLKIDFSHLPALLTSSKNQFVFDKGELANTDIKVKLLYEPVNDGASLRLAWEVWLDVKTGPEYWLLRVDALTGDFIKKDNLTVSCNFDGVHFGAIAPYDVSKKNNSRSRIANDQMAQDGGSYRVFPLPLEAPSFGEHTLVTNPADSTASPYGWHDTNGAPGAEYTITRGNNVHAYQDRDGDDFSGGDEPDGGADLIFDFPYNAEDEPITYQNAAVTNLFYVNNFIHDFAFHYGFDEAAGNFQSKNYSNQGSGGDYVRAEAQDGKDTGARNNANFSTPPDGDGGRMQMFLWDRSAGGGRKLLTVNAPVDVAGEYAGGVADYGPSVEDAGVITGDVVLVDDGVLDPYSTDGCESYSEDLDLTGKIAMVDRGGCYFEEKTKNAEDAGAIAIIICNFEDEPMGMAGVAWVADPSIPTISLGSGDCQLLKAYIENGLNATIQTPDDSGPELVDGDFDNGIIVHEYTHGISNRLTGGPNSTSCLGNEEQMGEGWSDFFALVATSKSTDLGEMARGVGTYAVRQNTTGRGIRRYPYSTDMGVNPLTYSAVAANTETHAVGEVWTAMLWDLYWAMIAEYGWDDDVYNGNGGNNKAVMLVMEGMKLQGCTPGFVDGRDAILAADELLFEGANQCLIWEVFARRGLGYSASQGSSSSASDGVEAFDTAPECLNSLSIKKTVSPLVEAGDDMDVTLEVGDYKQTPATEVVVTDEIPAGCTYVTGSANMDATVDGNTISFSLGTMNFLDVTTITYKVNTPADNPSKRQHLEDIPNEDVSDYWTIDFSYSGETPPSYTWEISDANAHSPSYAWYIRGESLESRHVLFDETPRPVFGQHPAFRFYHKFQTVAGKDGGIIEISKDNGSTWESLNGKMFGKEYTGFIDYSTFVIPNLEGFSGNSNGFVATYVDLSDYVGENVLFRFKYGSSESGGASFGWVVDDTEFMDMVYYNTQVCVTSAEGDNECAVASGKGTIIESRIVTGTEDIVEDEYTKIYPNPVKGTLNVEMLAASGEPVNLSLHTLDGRTLLVKTIASSSGTIETIDMSTVPSGLYILKIQSSTITRGYKIVVE